jgi:hypothetical protein
MRFYWSLALMCFTMSTSLKMTCKETCILAMLGYLTTKMPIFNYWLVDRLASLYTKEGSMVPAQHLCKEQ